MLSFNKKLKYFLQFYETYKPKFIQMLNVLNIVNFIEAHLSESTQQWHNHAHQTDIVIHDHERKDSVLPSQHDS